MTQNRFLPGKRITCADLLRPVDDLLGSADYKLYMTQVMLGEALEQAAQAKRVIGVRQEP